MTFVRDRFAFLFRSTKGLVLLGIGMVSLVTAIWGTISGPMAEWGVRDVTVRLLGMDLDPLEREGRIIILYHSIAMAIVAIEVYLITDLLHLGERWQLAINATVTVGYLTAMIFGMGFAYFGHNWAFHGVYLFGLSLMFFGGLMLAVALWPGSARHRNADPGYAHLGTVSLERVAFFTMAVATLGSALFGAIPGASFGNGFEAFLAEDIIREPDKPVLYLSIIGHLHIMLTLIAVALALLVGRWFDFKGRLHKLSMPLMIVGTIVITLGVWAVVPFEPIAHTIIYGGSTLILLAALLLVIFGFGAIIRRRLAEQGKTQAGFGERLRALLHDPVQFGQFWQMVFMNFTVSGIGIFMAVRLDEIFRVWPWREERITLTGHWHILSAIIATILLLLYADVTGLKGRARQWFGWTVILASDAAFAAVTVFSMKRLLVSEAGQQSLVNAAMLVADTGLVLVLVALAALMIGRLADLFRRQGRWRGEMAEPPLRPGGER